MKIRNKFFVNLSVALIGSAAVGGFMVGAVGLPAIATGSPDIRKGEMESDLAVKALAKGKFQKAVKHAEAAVGHNPNKAEYRALLGQAYMMAGRFTSASQALRDALTLDPDNGRVALNYALAKIADGDWAGARNTLQTYADQIPDSDRGLALALTGDPVAGIEVLLPAARAQDASAKTRQNLALALALAGRWPEARAVAALDISPDQLDKRISEWASFSRPQSASDQVASLLGVRAVEDRGQPVHLALVKPAETLLAALTGGTGVEDVDLYMPTAPSGTPHVVEGATTVTAIDRPAGSLAEPVAEKKIVFLPRAEIVQALPSSYRSPAVQTAKNANRQDAGLQASWNPSRGNFYVQLGAYENAAVAKAAWARHASRVTMLRNSVPHGSQMTNSAGSHYRLSVGGFARADAVNLCNRVRSSGGQCFVRTAAGDTVASWIKPSANTQLASR